MNKTPLRQNDESCESISCRLQQRNLTRNLNKFLKIDKEKKKIKIERRESKYRVTFWSGGSQWKVPSLEEQGHHSGGLCWGPALCFPLNYVFLSKFGGGVILLKKFLFWVLYSRVFRVTVGLFIFLVRPAFYVITGSL